MNDTTVEFNYVKPLKYMIQYKDAYGVLHNTELLARDMDSAWKLALDLIDYESRIQQIFQVK
jgi:hypothetical protein